MLDHHLTQFSIQRIHYKIQVFGKYLLNLRDLYQFFQKDPDV
jgi:hypothetical protein